MRFRTIRTAVTGAAAGVALVLAAPLAASAHVGITPERAEPGGYGTFTFTAPNESDTASTTSIEIGLPTDTPILSVRYAATPGWTIEVVEEQLPDPVTVDGGKITSAPTRIVITAEPGNGIRPGQFAQWDISMGPIPETGQISFPVVQSYDDGEIADWAASPAEVEADSDLLPAPTLFITDQPTGHHSTSNGDEPDAATTAGETASTPRAGSSSVLPLVLSIAALAAAAAALTATVTLFRRLSQR